MTDDPNLNRKQGQTTLSDHLFRKSILAYNKLYINKLISEHT